MYSVVENHTTGVEHLSDISPYWPVYSIAALLSAFGFIVNLLIMIITIVADDIVGDYRYFIFNMAFIDCISACTGVLGGIIQPLVNYDGILCSMYFWAFLWCRLASGIAKMPIVFNRYILLRYSKHYTSIFKPWVIVLLVCVCYINPMLLVTPFSSYFFRFGRVALSDDTRICYVKFNRNGNHFPMVVAGFVTLVLLDVVLLWCNCNILVRIRTEKEHTRRASVGEEQRQQLRNSNQLIRLNILQTLAPLLCHVPSFLLMFVVHFTSVSRPFAYGFLKYAFLPLSANPLLDGLFTFLLLRPYKQVLVRITGGTMQRDQRPVLTEQGLTVGVSNLQIAGQANLIQGKATNAAVQSEIMCPNIDENGTTCL